MINVPNLPFVPDLEAINRTVDGPHICGETIWIVNLWRGYWDGVIKGDLSIRPIYRRHGYVN